MNTRLTFIILAILFGASAASADPLGMLYSSEKLWHVNAFLGEGTVLDTVNRILKVTTLAGAAIVIFCLFAEGGRRFLGRDFELQDIFTFLGKYVFVAIFVSTSWGWGWAIYAIITPTIALVDSVQSVGQEGAMQAFGEGLLTAANAAYDGVDSLASTLFQQGVSAIVLGFASILALCISFAISLYVSVMWTILYVVGPMLLPCILFAPLSAIGWTWLRSFLAFCLMGVVGSMAMGLLIGGGMLLNAIKLGATADVIPAIAYAVVIVVVLVMVPKFTLGLFDGIGPDPMGVAATMKSLALGAASVGAVAVGAAAAGAGTAMKVAGDVGGWDGVSEAGAATQQFGRAAVASQFKTFERGMFPTFRSWGSDKEESSSSSSRGNSSQDGGEGGEHGSTPSNSQSQDGEQNHGTGRSESNDQLGPSDEQRKMEDPLGLNDESRKVVDSWNQIGQEANPVVLASTFGQVSGAANNATSAASSAIDATSAASPQDSSASRDRLARDQGREAKLGGSQAPNDPANPSGAKDT